MKDVDEISVEVCHAVMDIYRKEGVGNTQEIVSLTVFSCFKFLWATFMVEGLDDKKAEDLACECMYKIKEVLGSDEKDQD